MKKLVLLSIAASAFFFSGSSVYAQGISVELGLTGISPGGDFAYQYNIGVGVSVHPRFKLNDKMAVGINVGFDGFAARSDDGYSTLPDLGIASITTILGTFQYKFLERKIAPYAEIGMGMYNYKPKNLVDLVLFPDALGAVYEEDSYFGFAPKVGVMVSFLNIYAAYHAAGDLQYTQFGLGFRFGSK